MISNDFHWLDGNGSHDMIRNRIPVSEDLCMLKIEYCCVVSVIVTRVRAANSGETRELSFQKQFGLAESFCGFKILTSETAK